MNQPFILKALEVVAGILSLISLKWKLSGKNDTKELIKELEKKDERIIRLQIEVDGWKLHHKGLTTKRHLH